MTDNWAINIVGLTKSFGDITAVDHLDLQVAQGELFGLVGPDGAGKTTIMRLLSGVMEPTAGDAIIAGHSILKESERIKEKIGYMSQRFGLYEDLTVLENINFYADLYEVTSQERPARIERLWTFSNLGEFQNRLAGKLSGGMKQKLGLCCALIHTPEVLFLDEPTCGVDPISRRDLWQILYGLLREGITIFVSTAYLDEAERCNRIALIHKGRLIITDEPKKIRASLNLPMIELWADNARSAVEIVGQIAGVKMANIYGTRIHISITGKEMIPNIIAQLGQSGIKVVNWHEIMPSLEDIFIAKVG